MVDPEIERMLREILYLRSEHAFVRISTLLDVADADAANSRSKSVRTCGASDARPGAPCQQLLAQHVLLLLVLALISIVTMRGGLQMLNWELCCEEAGEHAGAVDDRANANYMKGRLLLAGP